MTSILEELYYGNISPTQRHYAPHSEYMQGVQLRQRNLDKLMATLDNNQKELFEKYCDAHGEIQDIAQYDTFTYALKLGAMLMVEVFMGKGELIG